MGCDDGLMRDLAGNAVCATSANLLVLRDRRWLTQLIRDCGVAGVMRGWLLGQGLVDVADLAPEAVETADALALCNAVRGILPVAALGVRAWPSSAATEGLRAELAKAHPGFAREQR